MGIPRALPTSWGVHVDIRLLGEIEVRSAGRPLDLGTPQQQLVLAALIVDARRPVAIETLVDRVWGHDPPANPRPVLYAHLSRIRRLLRPSTAPDGATPARIERRHAGYVLDLDPELVDLHRFRRLVEPRDDRQRDDRARAAALAEALRLWRGEPLAGLSGGWAAQVRASWHQRRLDAAVRWAQAELRCGRPAAVVSAVPDLAAEYPLAEPLEHVLIQALHATGRGAEALHRYGLVRRRLAEELGADPGKELRTLYRTVLIGDPTPLPRRTETSPRGDAGLVATAEAPTPTIPRRALLAVLAAATVSALALRRTGCDRNAIVAPSPSSVERARQLFASAEEFDQQDRTPDARATVLDAARLWGELIALDPDRNAPPLAPAALQALTRAGVDFTVPRPTLLDWLADPTRTPYPAISQVILLRGWRFAAPVSLDAVVRAYEHTPGTTSPRAVTEVHTDTLKAAVLDHARTRHGTQVTDFGQLLRA
ncbi:BTAD domain-containing putative transcriptional regulator [Kitasatospora sp. NPDC004615]|uniref:AfsR/SARP family transcriptional regulator n=1 Tax=Kitasatospora sp. NPDC004615 TaxID=3364017 RepID=UPI0036B83860